MFFDFVDIGDIGKEVLQSRCEQNIMCALCVIKSVQINIKRLTSIYNDENEIIESVKVSMDVQLNKEKERKQGKERKQSLCLASTLMNM